MIYIGFCAVFEQFLTLISILSDFEKRLDMKLIDTQSTVIDGYLFMGERYMNVKET